MGAPPKPKPKVKPCTFLNGSDNTIKYIPLEHSMQDVPGMQDLLCPDVPGRQVLCQDIRRADGELQADLHDV